MRNWNLRHFYLYLVSFVSLMLVVTGLIRGAMAAADYFFPANYYTPGPVDIYSRYKTPDGKETMPKEVIDQQIAFETAQAKANVKSGAFNELKRAIAYVAVALPVWIYHWRRVQIEAKNQSNPVGPAEPPHAL